MKDRVRAIVDLEPDMELQGEEIWAGLAQPRKELPPKYFYDRRGSELFESICELPEYYAMRTETEILRENSGELRNFIRPGAALIEYGSGSSRKTDILLAGLSESSAYVPIDIARDQLADSTARLRKIFPRLAIYPICADYMQLDSLPVEAELEDRTKGVFFPGSTLGNLLPREAVAMLRRMRDICGPAGRIILGMDIRKSREVLERAYNDAQGVTAAFNLNLLARLNRELGADFPLDAFRHRAFFNEEESRIEMHLVSLRNQTIFIGDRAVEFREGESIHTENSYKFSIEEVHELLSAGGFEPVTTWTDSRNYFGVYLAQASA